MIRRDLTVREPLDAGHGAELHRHPDCFRAVLQHHRRLRLYQAQRQFLDPFISSVLPIIVVASLLFGLLIIGSKQSQKVAATGFKATDIVRAGVALLFPVLLAQVNLRSKIGSSNIIYIEYFYFVLYTAILGVAANALLFTLKGHGISQYRDNLIPKLSFWPYLLGACFAVTLVFLY